MNLQHYSCLIKENKIHPQLLNGRPTLSFKLPATTHKVAKLYVVKYDRQFLYVGATNKSIARRMRSGLRPKHHSGYHGYKWATCDAVELYVWTSNIPLKDVEIIEAEMVYLIRKCTGKWPLHQNEIHFSNTEKRVKMQKIAGGIFNQLEHL